MSERNMILSMPRFMPNMLCICWFCGQACDELRYILDPADVYGPDFPGETFRVLKEKETKLYGEYRTRRLVLEAWDREHS